MNKKEFEDILCKDNITEYFLQLPRKELAETFGENFLKTVDYGSQNNASHQYDLFEHILRTVDGVQSSNLKIKIAAFLHDIGKPYVAKINEKTGQTQFIGHAKESANLANDILIKMGYSKEEIDEINFLIQCHDDFINISKPEEITPDRISKVYTAINKKLDSYKPTLDDMKNLITLCKADAMAQSDEIIKNGQIVDTKKARIARLNAIENILPESVILKQNQEIEKLKQQKITIQEGPKPKEKNGRIVNQKQIDLWSSKTEEQKQLELEEIEQKIISLEDEKNVILGKTKDGKDIHEKKALKLQNSVNELGALNTEIAQLENLKQNQK